MKKHVLFGLFLLALTFQLKLSAQQVTLNTAFGNSGVSQVPLADYEGQAPGAVWLQGNKILSSTIAFRDEYGYSGIISRVNPDGSLDALFGSNGYLYVCNKAFACFLRAYALQPDGKIVTLSNTYPHYDYPINQLWLERFLPNGQHDSTFGTNGAVVIARADHFDLFDITARSLAIKPDGKIVISATKANGFFMAQFSKNGVADNTFGVNGVITPTTAYDGNISTFIALPNNKLIAASTYAKGDGTTGTDLIQYTADGKIDLTFGSNGVALLSNTNLNPGNATALAIQNNKLLVYTEDAGQNVVYRCLANGSIDNSFGTSGKAYGDAVPGGASRTIKLQSNNKIIINNTSSFKLERFLPNGAIDNSFGTNGLLDVSLANNTAFDVNNNYLVVTGASYDYTHHYDVMQIVSYVPCTSCKVAASEQNAIARSIEAKVSVYPNPVSKVFTVSGLSDKGTNKLMLVNNAGAVVKQASTANTSYAWNVSDLIAGTYFIRIQTADAKEFKFKIIKQ